jgi:hypothetical protein
MSGKVLLIAFDFPPCQSPGVERTLRFAEYLQTLGWQPYVLTVNANVFGRGTEHDDKCFTYPVYRTFCLDISKHLAFRGKYIGWLKKPDRYIGWTITAIPKAISIINKQNIDVIWSTYPLLTSHIIGLAAAKLSKKPWLADYRDPLQCHYDDSVYDAFAFHRWVEKKIIARCDRAIFTTRGANLLYGKLYQQATKFNTIENGIEAKLLSTIRQTTLISNAKFVLLHLGSLYQNGRNPTHLYSALCEMKKQRVLSTDNFELLLIGSKTDNYQQRLIDDAGISDLVTIKSQVDHKSALALLTQVNGLLLIQGKIFNAQIPSKIYEYLATPLPIIALTSVEGDTAKLLNGFSGCSVVESKGGVITALTQMITEAGSEVYSRDMTEHTRERGAIKLAALLLDVKQEGTSK